MITKQMIAEAYDKGIAKLVASPNEDGTVCQIGDNWFYFGGETAEGVAPEVYETAVPMNDIIDEIFAVLGDFQKSGDELLDEYKYYECYLKEHGIKET